MQKYVVEIHHRLSFSSFPQYSSEEWLLNYCCRWRKPKREQLATRQYIDEYNASQALTTDDDIVVYQGVDSSNLPDRYENSVLQRISIHSNRDMGTTEGDQISLLCCEEVNNFSDVEVTVV